MGELLARLRGGLGRARRLSRSRTVLFVLSASVLYLLSWFVIEGFAVRRRQADFFENSARTWVELGALRFEEASFDRAVGTLFHPAAMILFGAPAALAAAGGLLAAALLAVGYVEGARSDSVERRERRARERNRLEELRIRADASAPRAVVSLGPAGTVVERILRKCVRCGGEYESRLAGECPNCGAPAGVELR